MHLGFVLHPLLYRVLVAMHEAVYLYWFYQQEWFYIPPDLKIINDYDLILRSCSCFYIV